MKIERLDAIDDSGNATQIVRTTPRMDASSLDGPASFDGLPTYRTLDGEHLNPSDGGFVGIQTERRFKLT
ncbi:hypothetical protein ABB27_02550 [Stenotrophomonas terrae]|uniref:Uncharacterized protein n=1 Tax=Stenotrophomonas terrae TaxID=405446 RepID=A0A0R0D354_9GAMM|nr:hypothetical protein [Stenotrophomonas terrae]KRG71784.1 hypothetical protein ABB27_02550 [Stenotrophomonas terrae]